MKTMRFELMAVGLDGKAAPTGEVIECSNVLEFVDEMAVRQPFNRCSAGQPEETMRVIAETLRTNAVCPVEIEVTGKTVAERAESFLRELVRLKVVRRSGRPNPRHG